MRGWQISVKDMGHRQEFVAGGLAGYATSEFKKASEMVGDLDGDWNEVENQVLHRPSNWTILNEPLKQLPQVSVFPLHYVVVVSEKRGNVGVLDILHSPICTIPCQHPSVPRLTQSHPGGDEQVRLHDLRYHSEDEVGREPA